MYKKVHTRFYKLCYVISESTRVDKGHNYDSSNNLSLRSTSTKGPRTGPVAALTV